MALLHRLQASHWLGIAWAFMLLLVAGISAVAIAQTQQVQAEYTQLRVRSLPALDLAQEVLRQVDEQRGSMALHLLRSHDAEAADLEARMQTQRQQLEQAMAAYAQRALGDAERRHTAALQAAMATFWSHQDQLIVLSRRGQRDPLAARQARELLSGDALQAYRNLRLALEFWVSTAETQLRKAEHHAQTVAQRARWLIATTAALGLGLAACAALWLGRRAGMAGLAAKPLVDVEVIPASPGRVDEVRQLVAAARAGSLAEPAQALTDVT
jgi:uncharacterized membrane-anchored protein YhcB (DUF1043 family)